MKNQYFGDINDFRKYGLLRMIQRASGFSIGVCWFLTSDDGGTNGELRKYISEPKRWRNYDSELFDKLQRLLDDDVQRSVSHAQAWGLVPGAIYFEEILRDSRSARVAYFEAARQALHNCDLIFVDPDNGIEIPSTKLGSPVRRNSCTGRNYKQSMPPVTRYSFTNIFLVWCGSDLFHFLQIGLLKSFRNRL